jgi:hypothetical protein
MSLDEFADLEEWACLTCVPKEKLSKDEVDDLFEIVLKDENQSLMVLRGMSFDRLTFDLAEKLVDSINGIYREKPIANSNTSIKRTLIERIAFGYKKPKSHGDDEKIYWPNQFKHLDDDRRTLAKVFTEKKYGTVKGSYNLVMGLNDTPYDFCKEVLFAKIAENEDYTKKALKKLKGNKLADFGAYLTQHSPMGGLSLTNLEGGLTIAGEEGTLSVVNEETKSDVPENIYNNVEDEF